MELTAETQALNRDADRAGPPADTADFDALVREHAPAVARLSSRLLGWQEDVNDVVQDVFATAWQKRAGFRGDSPVRTWLCGIAVNVGRRRRRRGLLAAAWWRDVWRGAAPRADLRRGGPAERLNALAGRCAEMQLQRQVVAARRAAIEKQCAEAASRAAAQGKKDAVTGELRRIVELRNKEVQRMHALAEKHLSPPGDADAAEIARAEARVRLAQHEQSLVAGQAEALADMNKEMMRLAVEDAETEVRLSFLTQEVERLKKLLPIADRCEQLEMFELPAARREVERAEERVRDLQRRLEQLRPTRVEVIGGE